MLREGVVVVGDSLALADIEESWTDVLREGVVVVGGSLALAVTLTKGRVTDDVCLAVEISIGMLTTTHHQAH